MIYHLYGHNQCHFCAKSKALLKSRNVQFFYHDVKQDDAALRYIKDVLQAKTVPQIVIEDAGHFNHIGGHSELQEYFEEQDIFDDM